MSDEYEKDSNAGLAEGADGTTVVPADSASHVAPTHTPGQWVAECCTLVEAQADGGFTWAHSVPGWTPHTRVGSVWQVASPSGTTGLPGSIEVSEANAHLIAAAPELYAALKWAEINCRCGARPESLDTHPHLSGCPIGYALAKAEGRDRQPSSEGEASPSVPSAAQENANASGRS